MQTVREKFTCRACETISQAPAPFHVLPRGFAGPSLLAMVLFEKYGQHQPLNRQSERYAREGVTSASRRSPTRSAAARRSCAPLYELIRAHVLAGERVHGDDTPCRCWPRARRRPGEPGSMCATTGRSAGAIRRRRCSTTRATGPASIPSVIWTAMPASCRRMPMPGSTGSTHRHATPGTAHRGGVLGHARRKFFVLADVAAKARGKLPVSRRSRSRR